MVSSENLDFKGRMSQHLFSAGLNYTTYRGRCQGNCSYFFKQFSFPLLKHYIYPFISLHTISCGFWKSLDFTTYFSIFFILYVKYVLFNQFEFSYMQTPGHATSSHMSRHSMRLYYVFSVRSLRVSAKAEETMQRRLPLCSYCRLQKSLHQGRSQRYQQIVFI